MMFRTPSRVTKLSLASLSAAALMTSVFVGSAAADTTSTDPSASSSSAAPSSSATDTTSASPSASTSTDAPLKNVITATNATILAGDPYDALTDSNVTVYDSEGNAVTVTSADISVSGVPASTYTPGSYPITITYLADGTTLDVTLVILAEAIPVEPSVVDNQIVIPVVTGLDYQIDGATVTGNVSVAVGDTATVTAVPQAGYGIREGTVYSWNFAWSGPGMSDAIQGTADSIFDGTNYEVSTGASIDTGGDADANGLVGLGAGLALIGAGAVAFNRRKH